MSEAARRALAQAVEPISDRLARQLRAGETWNLELFFTLSHAYDRITGSDTSDAEPADAAKLLYLWYAAVYGAAGLQSGTKGSKKNVNQFTPWLAYSFDTLYAWSVFRDCMLERKKPQAEFLLHMAVAFRLSPGECDGLLKSYGYLPLHVKNLHHLAIYTVLSRYGGTSEAQAQEHSQFDQVRELYLSVCGLVGQGGGAGPAEAAFRETGTFCGGNTEAIRRRLFTEGNLTAENLLELVSEHRNTFTSLHSAIRKDYFSLLDAFQPLYDVQMKGELWDGEEGPFCLFAFLNRFCGPFDHKHFNENVRTIIKNRGRHPTREFLIILWLYDYCFRRAEPVHITPDYRKKLKNDRLRACCTDRGRLDLGRYLCGGDHETAEAWDFAELVAYINRRLQEFGWSPLSRGIAFDLAVLSLGSFTLKAGPEVGSPLTLFCEGERFRQLWGRALPEASSPAPIQLPAVDNVPPPLTAAAAVLSALQDRLGPCPVLGCGLYELL